MGVRPCAEWSLTVCGEPMVGLRDLSRRGASDERIKRRGAWLDGQELPADVNQVEEESVCAIALGGCIDHQPPGFMEASARVPMAGA